MEHKPDRPKTKGESGTAKKNQPGHVGGDEARKAKEWGGGSKASKGEVSREDKFECEKLSLIQRRAR